MLTGNELSQIYASLALAPSLKKDDLLFLRADVVFRLLSAWCRQQPVTFSIFPNESGSFNIETRIGNLPFKEEPAK